MILAIAFLALRFIPAGAGNSGTSSDKSGYPAVYPRWRGELFCAGRFISNTPGLSPLARGTLLIMRIMRSAARFIPAGAGNSWPGFVKQSHIKVYPRWRGELFCVFFCDDPKRGLSPLARGTHPEINGDGAFTRFIPAGAGNSCRCITKRLQCPVYPRWRGELSKLKHCTQASGGLSPLARGTQWGNNMAVLRLRFIPAGAGNSQILHALRRVIPVYPRWRGELIPSSTSTTCARGLSPLARGTRGGIHEDRAARRFIPAGAGNSLKVYICS